MQAPMSDPKPSLVEQLRGLLSDDEYESARASVNNSGPPWIPATGAPDNASGKFAPVAT